MSSGEPMEPFGSLMTRYAAISLGEAGGRPAEDQIPHRPEPGLFVGLSQDVLSARLAAPDPEVVKVAEEVSYKRLVPHGASVEASIMEPSHVLPLRPVPKIQTIFSGLHAHATVVGLASGGTRPFYRAPPGLLEPRRQYRSSQTLLRARRPQGDRNDLLP